MKVIAGLHFLSLLCFVLFLVMAEENQKTGLTQEQEQPADQKINEVGPRRKTNWPELVGLTVEEAENKIKEDMPSVRFQVVPPNHFVTMDYQSQRVRLYLDSARKIARPPTIG